MRIQKIIQQHRRDFEAIYECEGCGHIERLAGYDDNYFYEEAVPNFKCDKCGKSRNDLNIKGEHVETRYPEGYQI